MFVEEFPAAFEEVVAGEFAFVAFFHEDFLGEVIGVHDAGAALEHAPRFAALDVEEHHLPAHGVVFHFAIHFGLEVHAPVGDVGAVGFIKHAAIDDILLCDGHEHVVHMNELAGLCLGDFLEVQTEARLGEGPMGDGVVVFVAGGGEFGFPPVTFDGGIALDFEAFLQGLAGAGVVNKFRHPAAIANHPGLICAHIIRHAVLGLAGGIALIKRGAAIFEAVEHRLVNFRGVGH